MTTVVARECPLNRALDLVRPGGRVLLATPGSEAAYVGNFVLSTSGTSRARRVTIAPVQVGDKPLLDGDASGIGACSTGSCSGPVLTVASGVYANLRSLTVQHGNNTDTGKGGGLDDGGDVALANSTFTGDDAASGGAIFVEDGAVLAVRGSTFSNNAADNGDGGAIDAADGWSTTGTVSVSKSTFTNDSATDSTTYDDNIVGVGGAIDSGDHGGSGVLEVTATSFTDDIASQSGGAIGNGGDNANGTATVVASRFTNNYSGYYGGAINSGGDSGSADLTIAQSTFTGNYSADGGAVNSGTVLANVEANITDSTFDGNSAQLLGGAVNTGYWNLDNAALTVTRSTFSSNQSTYGGAIDNGDDGGSNDDTANGTRTLVVTDSTFYQDSARYAGAIDNGDNNGIGTTTIIGSTFDEIGGFASVNNVNGQLDVAASAFVGSTQQDCYGTITDDGYNFSNDPQTSCGFTGAAHDVTGGAPELGPLQNNGGRTATLAPVSTDPNLLDRIPNPTVVTIRGTTYSLCPGRDQRGRGAPRVRYGCAIGSVDVANTQLPIISSIAPYTSPVVGGSKMAVVLTGVNLTGVTAISFGDASATGLQKSPTRIVAIVPPGVAGSTVEVTVTSPAGTSPFRPSAVYSFN
jgi:predicted outer membrane repeat protein